MANFCEQLETAQPMSTDNHAALMLSLESTGTMPNPNQRRETVSFGQVDSVMLRDDWEKGITEATPAPFSEYHSTKFPETKLCFFYRGHRMSESGSNNFTQTLSQADHALSKSEIQSLQEVLGTKADKESYTMLDARTQSLNGKRVLIVRGAYLENHYENETVYVDSDGSGSAVQEIYWQSPRSDYAAQRQVRAALRSISWK